MRQNEENPRLFGDGSKGWWSTLDENHAPGEDKDDSGSDGYRQIRVHILNPSLLRIAVMAANNAERAAAACHVIVILIVPKTTPLPRAPSSVFQNRGARWDTGTMRILVVEDEPELRAVLKQGLEEEGHTVVVSGDGNDALSIATNYSFDAIVLDVMLPGLDGFAIAKRLRAARIWTAILMLTAKDTVTDMVRGLDTGADDYLAKPFSFEVLLARLRALSRRNKDAQAPVLRVGSLQLTPATHEVSRCGRKITLTRTEFALLELLMRRPGQVMTREVIQDCVWGYDRSVESNTIDAFVRLLRNKIDTRGEPELIHTVRSVGYVLRENAD